TVAGRPLPVLPYGPFRFGMLLGNIGSVYRDGMKHLSDHADAVIGVEMIKAPVLLICGKADKLWPSCVMSRQIEARAKAHGVPSVHMLAYANAGHACIGPPSTKKDPFFVKMLLGGTDAGNRAA